MLQIEGNILVALHYRHHFTVESMRETGFVQHVRIPSRKIAQNYLTLSYSLKDVIHNLGGAVDLVDPTGC